MYRIHKFLKFKSKMIQVVQNGIINLEKAKIDLSRAQKEKLPDFLRLRPRPDTVSFLPHYVD